MQVSIAETNLQTKTFSAVKKEVYSISLFHF